MGQGRNQKADKEDASASAPLLLTLKTVFLVGRSNGYFILCGGVSIDFSHVALPSDKSCLRTAS
eukprot:544116-Lingulodinium_polyedra.AAC.1